MIDCLISPVRGDFQLIATSNPTIQLISPFAYTPSHEQEGHVVQLYTDDGFLIDVLSRFVGGALAVGDGAVVVATNSHRVALERRLSANGLDAAKAILQGRFVVLDATETLPKFMVNGSVDDQRFNDIIGGVLRQVRSAVDGKERRIAVFGELVALLWAEGKPQMAIRVEQLWNDLAESHSFSLLCAYPMTGFHNETHTEPFLTMCGQHSGVVPSESYLGLGSEEERLRSIAQLQQRALALEKELALRQSEERFRLLVEAVQDYAIFMLDPNGKVSSWNIGAERLKGYRATDIIGKHFSCFYPEEDKLEGKPDWELVIALKDGRFEDEGWRIRKDGSRFWASVVITAVRDDSGKLLGFAKITRDFTERIEAQRALHKEIAERRDAQRQLHNSEKSLRELSLHLLRTQDEERRRIGRDLHDSLGQYLAVLKMKLESVASSVGQNDVEASEDLAQCIRLTQDSIKEVRTVAYLLYPPMLEELGLQSAIPWYLDGFSERSSIQTTFKVQAGLRRLLRDGELALFRVLQESLTNVHRHSGSKIAHVRLLTKKGMCILEIEDEGKGIPSQVLEQSTQDWTGSQGVGVRGMNERLRQLGGRLELMSKKTGTTVRAMIPAGEPSSVTRT
jgi:PAS domain S-box-containing protein